MQPRDASGRFGASPLSALDRFRTKCRFDPLTGCVLWTGAQTKGRGHHDPYGAFWFEGERWLAHRWAAKHIHGLDIVDMQVDHCCPPIPRTLCVQHVQPLPPAINRALQWIRVQVGADPYPYRPSEPMLAAWSHLWFPNGGTPEELPYEPPAWLRFQSLQA